MEETTIREFLLRSGLKAKDIADRIHIGDRAVFKYLKGGKIPPYICRLIELEFTDYDLTTGDRVLEPNASYGNQAEKLKEKDKEIAILRDRVAELENDKKNLNQMIELLQNAQSKQNSA